MNPYVYVGDDPEDRIDSTGRDRFSDWLRETFSDPWGAVVGGFGGGAAVGLCLG